MMPEPVDVALREIRETRLLLETFLFASKAIDIFEARVILAELTRKIRLLARMQVEWSRHRTAIFSPAGQRRC